VVPRYLFFIGSVFDRDSDSQLGAVQANRNRQYQIIAALISSLPYNENPFAENLDDPNTALK